MKLHMIDVTTKSVVRTAKAASREEATRVAKEMLAAYVPSPSEHVAGADPGWLPKNLHYGSEVSCEVWDVNWSNSREVTG